jgi:cell division protein FtsW
MVQLKAWLQKNLKGDPIIWAIILSLCIISILVVYSSTGALAYKKAGGDTEHFLRKHSVHVLLALVAMWFAHKINYKYYSGLSKMALWLCIPLLVYGRLFGDDINEAVRSITIPVINQSFRPSDFAKLALIAALARMLARRQDDIDDFKKTFLPMIAWCGGICALIALSNFSTSVMLFSTCLLLMFIGRVPVKYIGLLLLVGMVLVPIGLKLGSRWDTTMSRIKNFSTDSVSFQAEQSYIALATGGIFGKGPGNSDQRNFLPHSYSDFIYSIIVEEYGLIGGVVVLFLFLALLYRGMIIVARSDRPFGGLLSAGLSFSLVIQALIHMGVAVGLGPVTGQPLPLLSMGGTSLLFTGISLGVILSVSRGDISENIKEDSKENSIKNTIAKDEENVEKQSA